MSLPVSPGEGGQRRNSLPALRASVGAVCRRPLRRCAACPVFSAPVARRRKRRLFNATATGAKRGTRLRARGDCAAAAALTLSPPCGNENCNSKPQEWQKGYATVFFRGFGATLDKLLVISYSKGTVFLIGGVYMEVFKRYPREPQARWDKRHLVTVSTHLTKLQWERLRYHCACDGVTVYALVREYLLRYISDRDAREWRDAQNK